MKGLHQAEGNLRRDLAIQGFHRLEVMADSE